MSATIPAQRLAEIRELAVMSGPDSAIAHALAEIDRLRGELAEEKRETAAFAATCKGWEERDKQVTAERDNLKQRLHAAGMTRVWTNEDGKKFVFVEDIAPHLLGTEGGEPR